MLEIEVFYLSTDFVDVASNIDLELFRRKFCKHPNTNSYLVKYVSKFKYLSILKAGFCDISLFFIKANIKYASSGLL